MGRCARAPRRARGPARLQLFVGRFRSGPRSTTRIALFHGAHWRCWRIAKTRRVWLQWRRRFARRPAARSERSYRAEREHGSEQKAVTHDGPRSSTGLLGQSKASTFRLLADFESPPGKRPPRPPLAEAALIGRLRGRVLTDEATGAVVLDVHGVGYDVSTPVGTLGRARVDANAEVELWIHTHVREDALDLFGFATETDRRVFRLLLGVPNVGPKTALGVLSAMPVDELSRAVERGDHARLGKIPGIGKKTAERLVLELKEKLRGLDSSAASTPLETLGNEADRLLSALVNMGYRPGEAERAVSALGPKLGTEPLGNLLREALAKLTP